MANQRGQIGVVILLIMVVLMTIGLSVATRTTQDLSISQQNSESSRVFNAAEAGVEQALSTDLTAAQDGQSVSVSAFNSENIELAYRVNKIRQLETRLFEGITVMADVTGVAAGQGVRIQWSKEDNCSTQDPASLLVSIYSETAGEVSVRHQGYAACDRGDNFTLGTNITTNGYYRQVILNLNPGDTFLRIKPLYNDTHVKISGEGWTLPIQYFNIRSEARSTLGDETRVIEVNRTLPAAPSIMDFALFSGTSIVK